ncbi:hypothetical protein SELMODRAFT_412892 [Selaginella moellendorffii]|uniref:Bifunctional inhibitor/plant lipid transfer protein/seed storage helical domain-containing protein n=1 Tax=Selaginella moellendorffii TaxID=88036 RepID=D8RMN7_SELML|nr:hypothetical protein SELMODRAFT_412892 [Selaginella moellendorffii]
MEGKEYLSNVLILLVSLVLLLLLKVESALPPPNVCNNVAASLLTNCYSDYIGTGPPHLPCCKAIKAAPVSCCYLVTSATAVNVARIKSMAASCKVTLPKKCGALTFSR